jgi:hypothetical protein
LCILCILCRQLKDQMVMLYALAENKFPGSHTGEQIIGNVLFLRFICPAIVSPDRLSLVSGLSYFGTHQFGVNFF